MRYLNVKMVGGVEEWRGIDVRSRRLHAVLVRTGLMPDEPFVTLSAHQERALQQAAEELFDEGNPWLTAQDKIDIYGTLLTEAENALHREEQEAERRKEAADAVRKAEVAFAEATAPTPA